MEAIQVDEILGLVYRELNTDYEVTHKVSGISVSAYKSWKYLNANALDFLQPVEDA